MTLRQAKIYKRKYRVENENVVYCLFIAFLYTHMLLLKPNERVVLEKCIQHESIYITIK